MEPKTLKMIQNLVGEITEENLRYVDCYVSRYLSIFIPSVGFCEYAIQPQHTHPSYSFVLFFSKEQSFTPLKLETGENQYPIIAISPEVPHEEPEADSFTRYIAIMIEKEYFETQFAGYGELPPKPYVWEEFIAEQETMLNIKQFMSEYENRLPGYEGVLDNLSFLLTHQLIRSLLGMSGSTEYITEKLEVKRVIEYMHQHFGEKVTLEKLAEVANMSQSHFLRTFKQETNLAPMEYFIRLRMEKAKKLLRSQGLSVTETALACGFSSPSHFSACFAKQLGLSPSEYQKNYVK